VSEKTKEELFDEAEENAAESIESLRFLQSDAGSTFVQNRFNASVLREYMRAQNLTWTAENLAEAYRVCKDVLRDKDEDVKPPAEPTPEPLRIVTDAERYGPWASLTKAQVKTMLEAGEYRKAMSDPRFVARVNALEIKRGEV